MRRPLLAAVLLSLACTRPNPAFGDVAGDDNSDASDEASDGDSNDSNDSGDSSVGDLPPGQCEFQPADGLAIKFGDPEHFQGMCPESLAMWGRVISSVGGTVEVESCSEGCTECFGQFHEFEAFPLTITNYLPAATGGTECWYIEAETLLFSGDESTCYWGALSVFASDQVVPYVIATTHSSPPTMKGADVLGPAIPPPMEDRSCSCDSIGEGNACCYNASGPPKFWYYPWVDDVKLFAGDYSAFDFGSLGGLEYAFKVIQAQQTYSCEFQDLQLSWAVVAVLD